MGKLSAEHRSPHHWSVRGAPEPGFRSWAELSDYEQRDIVEYEYPMARMLPAVMAQIPNWYYRRVGEPDKPAPYLEYFHDYSGAFCALVLLRSALTTAAKHLRRGRMDLLKDSLSESAYWAEQFCQRRAVARQHHGYEAPLPDVSDKIQRAKGCR